MRNGSIRVWDIMIDEITLAETMISYQTNMTYGDRINNYLMPVKTYGDELFGFIGYANQSENAIQICNIRTDGDKLRISAVEQHRIDIRGTLCVHISWDPICKTMHRFYEYGDARVIDMDSGKSFKTEHFHYNAVYGGIIFMFNARSTHRYDMDGNHIGSSKNYGIYEDFVMMGDHIVAFMVRGIDGIRTHIGMYDLRTGDTYMIDNPSETYGRLLPVVFCARQLLN